MTFDTARSAYWCTHIKLAHKWFGALLCGIAALAVANPTCADPPARVARLAFISGAVSFSPAGENDWVEAGINRPLITGDRLWVDNGSRAELQVGSAVFYLGSGTNVTLLNIDNRLVQLDVAQGTVNARVRRLGAREAVEIDTPNLAYSIRRPGAYRVDVDPADDATTVSTRNGQAEVYGDRASYLVTAGQNYRFYGADLRDYDYLDAPRRDEFDRWSDNRYRRAENSVAARYVSRDVIGYEDLDEYGSWRRTPEYGNVWVPSRAPAGWAPYRDGHWSWVEPWGWTWVDDAPWGFAVSHYGRWANLGGGGGGNWGWVPGPARAQPVYAPALVAFIAGSGAAASNNQRGNVGWFPLGPRDVYRPAYPVSRAYFNNVNTSNTTINNTTITNVYNNQRVTNVTYVNQLVPGAVVAMPAAAFAQSHPVSRSRVELPREAAARAPVTPVAAVTPVQTSVHGGAREGRPPPTDDRARPAVAKERPPGAPVPFAARERRLAEQPGRPLDAAALSAVKPATPAPAFVVQVVSPPSQPAAAPPPKQAVAQDAPRRRDTQRERPPGELQRGGPFDGKKGSPPAEALKAQPPVEAAKGVSTDSKKGPSPEAQKGPPPPEAQKGPPPAEAPKPPSTNEPRKGFQSPDAQKGPPFDGRRGPPPDAPKGAPAPVSAPPPPVNVPRAPEAPKAVPAEPPKAAPPPATSVPRLPEPPKALLPEAPKAPPPAVDAPRGDDRKGRFGEDRKSARPPEEGQAREPADRAARPPEVPRGPSPEAQKAPTPPPPVLAPRPPEPLKAPPPAQEERKAVPPPAVVAPKPAPPPPAPPVAPPTPPSTLPPAAPPSAQKPAPVALPPPAPKPPASLPPEAQKAPEPNPDARKGNRGERRRDDKKDDKKDDKNDDKKE